MCESLDIKCTRHGFENVCRIARLAERFDIRSRSFIVDYK